ncbi:MAG: hypothetical protein K2O60_05990 [Ruminococcus sp.]|nr:hypothetical protein [Ruminococcus sp.]
MAYADFTYYKDVFSGILITNEAMFRTFAERASDFIDTATFDRLADAELLERYKTKIQKCACTLAEQFFKRNTAVSDGFLDAEKLPKTSESIGSYSVAFANPFDYVQEVSMSDADFQKSLKSTVLRCLGNTGLLYRGVD